MRRRIVIVGSGFAGMWAALAARGRAFAEGFSDEEVDIVVVSPTPMLMLRPRLYERGAGAMEAELTRLFDVTGIRHVAGWAQRIDSALGAIEVANHGAAFSVKYDRLVLAAGSDTFSPGIPGLAQFAYNVDQLAHAATFEADYERLVLGSSASTPHTVVIIGAGFTGIEVATELIARLEDFNRPPETIHVVLVEQGPIAVPGLGDDARAVVLRALESSGIECRLASTVDRVTGDGVVLATGEFISSAMTVWAGGLRASALIRQVPCASDSLGRLIVEDDLSVNRHPNIFVAGDVACARTDDEGNMTTMSCLHAIGSGRVAGNNAAANLLGLPTAAYRQEAFAICLDLGTAGAILTEGREHTVRLTGRDAKALKRQLNSEAIYPPAPFRAIALGAAAIEESIASA